MAAAAALEASLQLRTLLILRSILLQICSNLLIWSKHLVLEFSVDCSVRSQSEVFKISRIIRYLNVKNKYIVTMMTSILFYILLINTDPYFEHPYILLYK